MMTLDELWESLRQDQEIKATMEEVEKSYKLFKKIENLIVADLESKLAESKESCILLEGLRKSEAEKKDIAMKRVYELKQQLKDKEKEIEKLKTTNDRLYKKNQKLTNKIVEDNIKYYKKGAVAELEKAKRDIINLVVWDLTYEDVLGVIDQQIKELKGGK